jgi:hypothetical protein
VSISVSYFLLQVKPLNFPIKDLNFPPCAAASCEEDFTRGYGQVQCKGRKQDFHTAIHKAADYTNAI